MYSSELISRVNQNSAKAQKKPKMKLNQLFMGISKAFKASPRKVNRLRNKSKGY